MSADPNAHYELQIATLQQNLRQSESEVVNLKKRDETLRKFVLELGQATVSETLAAIPSTEAAAGLFAPPVKTMETEAIIRLIQAALVEKLRKLIAFGVGVTDEQRNRFLARILETDVQDWVNDPGMAELMRKHEAANREIETLRAQVREFKTQQEATARTVSEQSAASFALKRENADLQRQLNELLAVRQAQVIAPNPAVIPATPMPALPATHAGSITSAPVPTQEQPKYERTVEDSSPVLISILATRGWCERTRLAEAMTAPEFDLAREPNHLLINGAFQRCNGDGLIESLTPRNETGVGRVPILVRLTDAGRAYARDPLHIEPVPSELNRLLEQHDSPEHVALILATRRLFIEKYPEPVANVNLFPDPISVEDGKRSEPDLIVTLGSGKVLNIECERGTQKDAAKRADKWHKAWVAGHGEIYVVCPDKQTNSTISSEIAVWYASHGGKLRVRVTSIYQTMNTTEITGENFWAWRRDFTG